MLVFSHMNKFSNRSLLLGGLLVISLILAGWFFVNRGQFQKIEKRNTSDVQYKIRNEILNGIDFSYEPCGEINYCDPNYLSKAADKTYHSKILGVSFRYIGSYAEKIVEKGNEIYIFGEMASPLEDEQYFYDNHLASIFVYKKSPNESLQEAVQNIFFSNQKSECVISEQQNFSHDYLRLTLPEAYFAKRGYNQESLDPGIFLTSFRQECKIPSLPTSSYFMSSNDPSKFFLIDTHQDHPIFVPASLISED